MPGLLPSIRKNAFRRVNGFSWTETRSAPIIPAMVNQTTAALLPSRAWVQPHTTRAPRPRRDQARQSLDEGPPRARRIAAVQASHRQLQSNRAAKAGKIRRVAHGLAVDGSARRTTVRAPATPLPRLSTDVKRVGIRAGDPLDPAAWHKMKVRHPGLYSRSCCATVSRTGSTRTNHAFCGRAGFLDTGLHYAARLKVVSRRAARASAGLRQAFFLISHSVL